VASFDITTSIVDVIETTTVPGGMFVPVTGCPMSPVPKFADALTRFSELPVVTASVTVRDRASVRSSWRSHSRSSQLAWFEFPERMIETCFGDHLLGRNVPVVLIRSSAPARRRRDASRAASDAHSAMRVKTSDRPR